MDSPLVRRTRLRLAPPRLPAFGLALGLGLVLADGAFIEGALAKMDPPIEAAKAAPQPPAHRTQSKTAAGPTTLVDHPP